jgi:hypothetical protein
MADLLSLPNPPPDFPPPIEACGYVVRLSELLMLLISLGEVFKAGREKGAEFVGKILHIAYEVGFEDIDTTLSVDELGARKAWREERASKEADEVVAQHARLVYSLALIMACSTLEQFLNHLLDVLLTSEPRIAGGRTMRLGEVYDAKTSSDLLSRFRDAEIRDFDRLSIKEKVEYLVRKCNIRREVLFSFNNCDEEHRKHAKALGEGYLYSTFATRNTIAHRGERPINDIRPISDAVGFFQALILQWSASIGGKYSIPVIATAEEDVAWEHRDELRRLKGMTDGGK